MIQWSLQQEQALKAVDHWFKNETKTKPFFYIGGYAGTGKTTLAKHFAQNIEGSVKFATFTGKAAHVMAQKGCLGASTIHQLIYIPKGSSRRKLHELEERLEIAEAQNPINQQLVKDLQKAIQAEQQNVGRMSFDLNRDSDLRFARLLIIDEVSMVDIKMAMDLLSFNIPILVLGDPEQLPPVFGEGYFTEHNPDILLTEIHRQALDNPIIAMSKTIREGKDLSLGNYGSSRVINIALEGEDVLSHDIILTGLRKTKAICDKRARRLLGRTQNLPQTGDKLMCVKNNHNIGILNGQTFQNMSDAVSFGDGLVSLYIKESDTGEELAVTASEKLLLGIPLERYEREESIEEFEYAYAITVHKSQGSQWNDVLLFDQKDKFPNWSERNRRRWLYTGLTRAAERVTVIRL